MRAAEFIVETAMMGKIADSGKIIRILKKAHTVPFSDEKNWLLVDTDPGKGNSGLGIKWIPADTRFEWVRPYRDTVEQGMAEDQNINLDIDYFMNEGCGIFAVAMALNEDNSQIYIISNKNGQSWSKSFPYEISHVFVNVLGKGQFDIRGKRSPEKMANDFNLNKEDYSIKGPFAPKEFFSKFMGDSDTKPLYGTSKDIKQVQQQIKSKLDEKLQGVAEGFSNAVTFFRGEPILSQERLNQLKSSIGKPYPILRKEGSAANIGTYMSPDGDKATSFVKQALAGQGKGGVVTQIQVNPNSFSKGDGGIDEAVIITNIAGLVSNQTPNKNDPLRIQDRKQAMLKYLGPGVKKYLNDPLLSDPKIVQSWYNPEFAQKNWNTINSGKQAVTKPGESNMQERMIRILGPLAENIRRDPEIINYFISHNPGDWVEYNFRMNSDGSGTKVVDVKYYPPAKQGVAEGLK